MPINACLFLLLAVSAAPATSESHDQEALVRTALTKVPAIASAARTLEANRARVEAAKGGYYPSLTLSAGATGSNSANPATAVTAPQVITTAGGSAHQEIYNFGRTAAQVATAQGNLELAVGSWRDQSVEVAHNVRRAYVSWVQAKGLEDQERVQVEDDRRVYEQTVAFYKAGTRAKLDVTRARFTLEQARANLLAARTSTEQARAVLATAVRSPLPAMPHAGFAPVPPVAGRPLAQLRQQALINHPTVASAQARVALARAARQAAEAADKPDLGADASAGGRARDLDLGPSFQIGVNATWPILNGGAFERNREATRLAEAAAIDDLASQQDAVLLGVDNAYLAMRGAAVRLPATEAELASARENLFQAEGRYKAGVGSIIEVSDAQALLATAEADQLRALAVYHLAIADVIAAVGLTGTEQ